MASFGAQTAQDLSKSQATSNKHIETAFAYIDNLFSRLTNGRTYSISSTGYVSNYVASSCPMVKKDIEPRHILCNPPEPEPQVRLVLYSDYEWLKNQYAMLSGKLLQLESRMVLNPVTNSDIRKSGSTLYPQYGDWLLTSDSSDQYISFSGLSAAIGKSIYIQTRRQAYLYCNNQSFYGLPGSSTRENQWLSHNTTYRFVRVSADSWCVTSSSSPYPWT